MLNRVSADISIVVNVKQCIFVEVTSLHNISRSKLNVESVPVLEVLDFHTQ